MYKISIIIPVYNAENTIKRCIASIMDQKWKGNILEDIEIILIDDHSTDNSKSILDYYNKNYPNINVYTTERNSGSPSVPRNIGIKYSKADYIMFLDNDDEYLEDMCQTLYDSLLNNNVDVVSCRYNNIDSINIRRESSSKLNVEYCEKISGYIELDSSNAILLNDFLIWNKIFKKSIIQDYNITFPTTISEDFYFCINYFSKIDKMIFLSKYYGLNHYSLDDSLSHSLNKEYVIETIDGFDKVYKLIESYVNLEDYPYSKFNNVRPEIIAIIIKLSIMENKDDKLQCLEKLHWYESKVGFDNSLDNIIFKGINFFILRKNFRISLLLLDLMKFIKKSDRIRLIYRKL